MPDTCIIRTAFLIRVRRARLHLIRWLRVRGGGGALAPKQQAQQTATHCHDQPRPIRIAPKPPLQHTATHCNTLQHTATHCNTLQHCHDRPRPIRIVFLWGTKSACCQVFRLRWETHKNSPKIAYSQKIADLSTHEEVPPRGPSTSSWGSGGRAAVFGVFSLRR